MATTADPYVSYFTDQIGALGRAGAADPNHDHLFEEAISACSEALTETIAYLESRKAGKPPDRDRELRIAHAWQLVSQKAAPVSPGLAQAFDVKGLGWIDAEYWHSADREGIPTSIEAMIAAKRELMKGRYRNLHTASVPQWFPIVGVGFAAAAVLFLMYAFLAGVWTADRRPIFEVLIAFLVAGAASFFGGSAVANGSIPFFKNSPITFSAVGGVGTFIVVYLIVHFSM